MNQISKETWWYFFRVISIFIHT